MAVPTVDLSPFFKDGADEDEQQKSKDIIRQACSEYGFFQIVNHGVPADLMSRALKLSREFFTFPEEEKRKYSPIAGAPLPAGYNRQPQISADKNEYVLMFQPQSSFNILPADPPEFRDVLQELFTYFSKTAEVMEEILNECFCLPPHFLKQYDHDRDWDFMVALRYFPATETENNGIAEHEDGNMFTFVIQDEVGGLQVKKDGNWIPIAPAPDKIVVNLSDVIQVLSNNKFKSATHRVVRSKERSRHSFAFFRTLHGDKWVAPLPQFIAEMGEKPKYRGFVYKDYQAMRMRNKSHPPEDPKDVITIDHYSITSAD